MIKFLSCPFGSLPPSDRLRVLRAGVMFNTGERT
jgi:hypothetical protein